MYLVSVDPMDRSKIIWLHRVCAYQAKFDKKNYMILVISSRAMKSAFNNALLMHLVVS